jgi:hypothetical protein
LSELWLEMRVRTIHFIYIELGAGSKLMPSNTVILVS